MLMITDDLGAVAEIADNVAVMYAVRIVESGPVAAIVNDPAHPYTLGLMASMPGLHRRQGRLVTIPGSVPSPQMMPAASRFAPRCPFAEHACTTTRPDLVVGDHRVACLRAPLELSMAGAA